MFNRKIIKYLGFWKDKPSRKPLVLRGARQVGKTSAILIFGKKFFKDTIYINLENIEHLRLFRGEISLEEFKEIIKIKFHKIILPGQTLIFIDEIQNSSSMIKLLRFFYELMPEVHIIAAGSLLETKIEKEGFSFPVGRVEFAYLYPLDFFEYLGAKKENELLEYLQKVSITKSIPEAIHRLALKNFYEYTAIGGMPEIVKSYIEDNDFNALNTIYASLFTSYSEDVYRYSSLAEAKYLNYVIEKAPLFAGSAVTYEKFGSSNYRSREMSRAFDVLGKVMLLYQVPATKSGQIPFICQKKRPKKLIFLDVGLVNYRMGIQQEYLNIKDLNDFYRGRIAEQVTGQNILAQLINAPGNIFYWAKDKSQGSAEVDFCLAWETKALAVEVKSANRGRLKSLFIFSQKVKNSYPLRVYSGILKKEQITSASGKFEFISIPFYLIPRIFDPLFMFSK